MFSLRNLLKVKKPTICVECEHCTPGQLCRVHQNPVQINYVTGKQTPYRNVGDWMREERVFTNDLLAMCREINEGRCRKWAKRVTRLGDLVE